MKDKYDVSRHIPKKWHDAIYEITKEPKKEVYLKHFPHSFCIHPVFHTINRYNIIFNDGSVRHAIGIRELKWIIRNHLGGSNER